MLHLKWQVYIKQQSILDSNLCAQCHIPAKRWMQFYIHIVLNNGHNNHQYLQGTQDGFKLIFPQNRVLADLGQAINGLSLTSSISSLNMSTRKSRDICSNCELIGDSQHRESTEALWTSTKKVETCHFWSKSPNEYSNITVKQKQKPTLQMTKQPKSVCVCSKMN